MTDRNEDFGGLAVSEDKVTDTMAVTRSLYECEVDAGQPSLGQPDCSFGSSVMKEIHQKLQRIAAWDDVPVVFQGESGVGKEVLARKLHAFSLRADQPFVKLNCAAIPAELLESELFGHERGAFTGAFKSTIGKFEAASGGTLFLDEIGDMDITLQSKLLHVLQDWEFYRVGGNKPIRVNVRILAATHRDLERAVREERFRQDLYYRLNVINIRIPPLRERRHEILPLAKHFLTKHRNPETEAPEITQALEDALLAHPWPGNVRELENVVRRLLVLGDPDLVAAELSAKRLASESSSLMMLSQAVGHTDSSGIPDLQEVNEAQKKAETEVILTALNMTHWNRRKAAVLLNVDYKGLLYKMKKFNIEKMPLKHGRIPFETLSVEHIV